MARHFFPMSKRLPCPKCQQPWGVVLNVTDEGFSCVEGIQHLPDCPTRWCPHGVLWTEDCYDCALRWLEKVD
jgi:hypothetical protein